ncbi:hypothetical protein DIPPA_22587 [Diplonema papillatum]|nr:hypothetical protein DIPPA_22587 [Diplonema papillatum]
MRRTAVRAVASALDLNPFSVLGVAESAGPSELRRAYLSLVRVVHPDINAASSSVHRMQEVNWAYKTAVQHRAADATPHQAPQPSEVTPRRSASTRSRVVASDPSEPCPFGPPNPDWALPPRHWWSDASAVDGVRAGVTLVGMNGLFAGAVVCLVRSSRHSVKGVVLNKAWPINLSTVAASSPLWTGCGGPSDLTALTLITQKRVILDPCVSDLSNTAPGIQNAKLVAGSVEWHTATLQSQLRDHSWAVVSPRAIDAFEAGNPHGRHRTFPTRLLGLPPDELARFCADASVFLPSDISSIDDLW